MSGTTAGPGALAGAELVAPLAEIGVFAFTTGRAAGSFGMGTDEPVRDVMARWASLRAQVVHAADRLATATQVHGDAILTHGGSWRGWLRSENADGHLSLRSGTAMAVTVADCVPVFVAHPGGAVAVLHSGWRGTAARIVERAIRVFLHAGLRAADLRIHCGPAICGRCYEVSGDVHAQLTGRDPGQPTLVDLRQLHQP